MQLIVVLQEKISRSQGIKLQGREIILQRKQQPALKLPLKIVSSRQSSKIIPTYVCQTKLKMDKQLNSIH